MAHYSVLAKEVLDLINLKTKGIYVDLTLGGGGHSLKLLKELKAGSLIGFDLEKKAIDDFGEELKKMKFKIEAVGEFDGRVDKYIKGKIEIYLVNDNFTRLKDYIEKFGIKNVNGILADLGWSSNQLESIEGLSYDFPESELDMRMDPNLGVTAADLLNALGRKELEKMFMNYSDIYGGKNQRLVEEINKFKKTKLIQTVGDLLYIVDHAFSIGYSGFGTRNKYDIYAKVFQALRIAVNSELTNLKDAVPAWFESLNKDGRLLVITFHSGEEKVVTSILDEYIKEDKAEYLSKGDGNNYLRPTIDELKENIKSRSAKLFCIKKLV